MTNAEQYRAQAEELEKKAKQAKDAEAKRVLMDAAQEWRLLAAMTERQGW